MAYTFKFKFKFKFQIQIQIQIQISKFKFKVKFKFKTKKLFKLLIVHMCIIHDHVSARGRHFVTPPPGVVFGHGRLCIRWVRNKSLIGLCI